MLSAKSQTAVISVDEILRMPTAKLASSEDDIRKYMLENITEEQFKELKEQQEESQASLSYPES